MKNISRLLSIILVITAFTLAKEAHGNESELLKAFSHAYNTNIGMKQVIEDNRGIVPSEIISLLEQSHRKNITPEAKAQKQLMAETMARAYNNVTGEISYLIEVKKDTLNLKLHAPVNTLNTTGIHMVEMPRATADEKNAFIPDNIVIRAGETIRWVNNASLAQKLSSMPLIGKQVLFTDSIEPDKSWEHRFDEAGEYYYFGYNHNSMVGKVTVLPAVNGGVSMTKKTTNEKR